MPISFGSINTGLPPNIVEQMVEAERYPLKTMQVQKEKSEAKLKLVEDLQTKIGEIRKGLGELASTRGFSDVKITSGDPNILQGTIDPSKYQAGNWNIEVMELATKASAITNGFPDKDKTTIGVGYFRFKTPGGDKDVYVSEKSNTLEGAAKVINNAGLGVRASIINDRKDPDAPFRLVLSADEVGADKSIEYPRIYMLDGDQDIFFDERRDAKNGKLKVDGFEFEIADNKVTDVVPGATLDLKAAAPGKSVNVLVKEDVEVVSGKIKTFVDGMNGVLSFIQSQNKMDQKTDTSRTLGGDGMLRSVEQRIRSMILNPQYNVGGGITSLGQLGIQFNRQGTLEYDQKKFDAALASNPNGVQAFLVGDGFRTGFINTVKREVGSLLNPNFGAVANRAKGLKDKVGQLDERMANKERQLSKREDMLRMKFSRLEETMSKIKAQGGQVAAMAGLIQSGAPPAPAG